MKLDSKYFDSIRVSGGRSRSRRVEPKATVQPCQWSGCPKRGLHKAPKSRASEGEYYYFCRDHVTEYNKSYNYFDGMNDGQVADYQKSASTGHRPTWGTGVNATKAGSASWEALRDTPDPAATAKDPFELLRGIRNKRRAAANAHRREPKRRIVQKAGRKHLMSLNLDENASAEEIRTQFKALVKLHHPDHNGGDRSSEERFREVLAAYNFLKHAGLC